MSDAGVRLGTHQVQPPRSGGVHQDLGLEPDAGAEEDDNHLGQGTGRRGVSQESESGQVSLTRASTRSTHRSILERPL